MTDLEKALQEGGVPLDQETDLQRAIKMGGKPIEPSFMDKASNIGKSIGKTALDVAGGTLETGASIATGIPASILGFAGSALSNPFVGDEKSKGIRELITNTLTYQPRTESGKSAMDILGVATAPLTIPRRIGEAVGGEAYGNVGDALMMGIAPKIPGAVKGVRNSMANQAEALMTKALSPTAKMAKDTGQQRRFAREFLNTADDLTGKKPNVQYSDQPILQRKVDIHTRDLNNALEKGGVSGKVHIDEVLSPIDDAIKGTRHRTDAGAAQTRMAEVKAEIKQYWLDEYPDGMIPIDDLQGIKVQGQAFAKYGKDGKPIPPEIDKAVARGAKEAIEKLSPEVQTINQKLFNAKRVRDIVKEENRKRGSSKFTIAQIVNSPAFLSRAARGLDVLGKKSQPYPFMPKDFGRVTPYVDDPDAVTSTPQIESLINKQIGYDNLTSTMQGGPVDFTRPLPRPTRGIETGVGVMPQIAWDVEPQGLVRGKNLDLTSANPNVPNYSRYNLSTTQKVVDQILEGTKPIPSNKLKHKTTRTKRTGLSTPNAEITRFLEEVAKRNNP